jgi:XTP/dITP diphosphohydrolase
MKTLYCATTNPGKLREFQLAAHQIGHGWIDIDSVPGLSEIPAPVEDGKTFAENAVIKAIYYSRHVAGPVFCDDSGLAVDALDGAPGVHSARYAGESATDEDNNRLLLSRMEGVKNRSARFVCVVALADQGNLISTYEGKVEGELTTAPSGENGFGYDPLFFYPPFGCTLAEVSGAKKFGVSHRGKAVTALLEALRKQP